MYFNIIYLYFLHGNKAVYDTRGKTIFMLNLKLVAQIWSTFQIFDVAIFSYF